MAKRAAPASFPRSEPLWFEGVRLPGFPPLDADAAADVAVVGGGIAGLTTAYLLAKSGATVALVEDGGIGSGMSGATSAHLTLALDRRYDEIMRVHGPDGARLAAESHGAAIDRIESLVGEEDIACDFARVDGYLFAASSRDVAAVRREQRAAEAAGVPGVELVERDPFVSRPAVLFPRQARFHPLRYLAGLARAAERLGVRIYGHTHAGTIEGGRNARVVCGPHSVSCRSVVVATNSPVNDRIAIHLKQAPYMTYVVGIAMRRGTVPDGLYWDTLDPFHYVRLQPLGDADGLIIGGEDHKSGQAEGGRSPHARLERWARERVPGLGAVRYRWGGQVMETLDGLAFIGRNPIDDDNVYVATGDSGNGLTHGTIAGMLLTDLILGRPNRWAGLYDPARKPLMAAGEAARESLNAVAQYADWVTPGEVGGAADVRPGSGAVVRCGFRKEAIYRDDDGAIHRLSAVCPHMGCIVQWNGNEKTWDCPCHGSRFEKTGRVINGPANRDLEEIEN